MFLELGFNESLRSSSSTVKHIEESAITDTCSSEPADYGLSLLFTAGKLIGQPRFLGTRLTDRGLIWRDVCTVFILPVFQ